MPTVEFSAVIDGDADRIWNVLKRFGKISEWIPAIAESITEGDQPDGMVGSVRRIRLQDGSTLRERLLSVDDRHRRLSYCIEESFLPLDNYVAAVILVPLTGESRTFIHWTASFDLRASDAEGQYEKLIAGLFSAGNDSLQAFVRKEQA
ncbi:SRPBCC family protein [Paraburkholderia tuberum]|uniref:Polyketide cyclase / dehydrase and lipid transport n=1 Tax=Paraburkholderia tuberum TaxID=157910 RepID=A0A1H1KH95_9BURK|nr:SRPBCC family protein [Paraburkholderia tuberum]SDR61616.1 Polyketide cyclase / dehydrase and lipid transport [Paraburkholderia tuberum]